MSETCPFCAIVAGSAPAGIFYRDERVVGFVGLRQPNAGHVLLVPRRHVATVFDLEPVDASALFSAVPLIARALRAAMPMDGLSLWQSNGEAGGQEIDHVHLHLLPRLAGDGLMKVYGDGMPTDSSPELRETIAARLRAALDGDGERAPGLAP